MPRDVSGYEEFIHHDIQRKLAGEAISEKMAAYFRFMPRVAFTCFVIAFISIVLAPSLGGFAQFFFTLGLGFGLLSLLFIYMVTEERPDTACIGVINEARDTQFKNLFSGKRDVIKYYAHVGTVVHNFLGKDAKEAIAKNLTPSNTKYDMLLDKDIYTMGYLLPGSTGSGKTVTLNSTLFLPAIKSGNGFFYVEGKGDRPITEGILAFINMYGREHDVFVLDFGAAASGGYTNGLNPLAIGNSKSVGELLKNLIDIMKGDNKWVSDMAIAFLEAILLPLVLLRDLKYVINPKVMQSVKSFGDLKKQETFEFNIGSLLNFLNFQAAIDLHYMIDRLIDDRAFMAEVRKNKEYSSLKKDFRENILGRLGRNLTGHNIPMGGPIEPSYAKDVAQDVKRNHPKATEDWINALEIFGSEKFYGNVFNKTNSDFDALTAIQQGKIIIWILPSMSASEEQNKKMGQMVTSIAKSAIGYMLEKGDLIGDRRSKLADKRLRPRKLPYSYVFDEPSNYASSDIAQMSSMIRSVGSDGGGMALVWTGQSKSDADKIDDDKKLASQQLLANLGFTQTLNIQDKGWKELMKEKVGETYVWSAERYEGLRDDKDESFRTLSRNKEFKYEENYFEKNLRPKTGESIVVVKGYAKDEKMVASFNVPPSSGLRLNKNISFKELMATFKTDDEVEKELQELRDAFEEERLARERARDVLDKSYQQEVRDLASEVAISVFPAEKKVTEFTLQLHEAVNPRAHGDYTSTTTHINIYNAINKPREHLVATALHEVAHHVEYVLHGDTGHSKRFYGYMYELFKKAIELGYIDYALAKAQNAVDAGDIKRMEDLFDSPDKR